MDVGEDKEDRSSTARIKKYKNKGLSVEEGRKKREEEGFQLRKSKRDEQVSFLMVDLYHIVTGHVSPGKQDY